MVIRNTEPGSEAFYLEGLNIAYQYKKLKEKPARRLRNPVVEYACYSVLCLALVAMLLVMGYYWGFSGITYVGLAICGIAAIMSANLAWTFKKRARAFLKAFVPSVFTMEEDGITMANSQTKTLRMAWENVQFVRVFKECICFMAKEETGFVISVSAKHKDKIIPYVKEKHPEVLVIE